MEKSFKLNPTQKFWETRTVQSPRRSVDPYFHHRLHDLRISDWVFVRLRCQCHIIGITVWRFSSATCFLVNTYKKFKQTHFLFKLEQHLIMAWRQRGHSTLVMRISRRQQKGLTQAGLEPTISCSVGRRLIHWATEPWNHSLVDFDLFYSELYSEGHFK